MQGRLPSAVLLDRDGTLVVDAPVDGDPARVEAMPGAAEALARLREAGVPTALIAQEDGLARGDLSRADVEAVHRRMEELVGPVGPKAICPHAPEDGCRCRTPLPGLVLEAASTLGVPPERCAVIGDTGTDVRAATAAGARGILVPSLATDPADLDAASETALDLPTAVDRLLAGG